MEDTHGVPDHGFCLEGIGADYISIRTSHAPSKRMDIDTRLWMHVNNLTNTMTRGLFV